MAGKVAVASPSEDPLVRVRHELDQRLARGELELPLLPGVAMEVTSAAARDDDARRIADILKRDPALAAHLLRVVNSPLYSPRNPIISLQQAVARVGASKIREIALVVACQASVFKVKGHELEVSQVFRHSVGAALFAQEVARQTRNNVEDAFLCGLLHDVGRPVLLQALLAIAGELGLRLESSWLVEQLGELHCVAGTALARSWSLPDTVCRAIREHHHAELATQPACVQVAALADALSHAALDEEAIDGDRLRAHPALALLEIYPDVLEKIVSRAEAVKNTVQVLS